MHDSLYIGEPGVPPVRIETYRGVRRRVRFGTHTDRGPSVLHDCFPDAGDRSTKEQHHAPTPNGDRSPA